MDNSPHTVSIHILDDNSLLNVFYLYRPFFLGEDQDDEARVIGGAQWVGERWWYKFTHVCRRWRNVILGSASYLGLSLVCTRGTPVADMLADSPPLPLVIDYLDEYRGVTAQDEEGTTLALKQRGRVRRVRLDMPAMNLQTFIMVIDEEYPILEYLVIWNRIKDTTGTILVLPEKLQAPRLRHLALVGFALPIGSRLLSTAVGLVTLCLVMNHPSTYVPPNTLLLWLSSMPRLETLVITFLSFLLNIDAEGQLAHTPAMTPVALPNLHFFTFRGGGTWRHSFIGSQLAPRSLKSTSSTIPFFPFHVSCSLWARWITPDSTVPNWSSPIGEFV